MNRDNFYEKLSDELLGCFYYFVQARINKGVNLLAMQKEKSLIEKVAKERDLSLSELKFIGYVTIQNEISTTYEENE